MHNTTRLECQIRGVDILFGNIENPKSYELLKGMLERCAFLFPSWLTTLQIDLYDDAPEGSGVLATCYAERWQYGRAVIDLYAKFFERCTETQYEILIHELVHVMHGKVLAFTRNEALEYVKGKNEDLFKNLTKQHNDIIEEFTVMITTIIMGMGVIDANR